jgi:polygalacturonase
MKSRMNSRACSLILLIFWSAFGVQGQEVDSPATFKSTPVPLPSFKNDEVKITDFGAVGDGTFVNTIAFKDAITALSNKGGGKVIIPRGIWLTGPIELKSNINLHAEKGALVVFTTNMDDYPLVETSFEGLNTYRCLSPIYGKSISNIAITGEGIFDGSGDAWRPVKKSKLTDDAWKKLVASGGVLNESRNTWYPSEKSLAGAKATENFNVPDMKTRSSFESVKDFLRPVMVSLVSCKNVLLDGPTFQNSPAWCLHPLMCEDVTIKNLTIRNPWYSQNGDGLDLESCRHVMIDHCSFDVGDDAICLKSGKDKVGRDRGMPTEDVVITDCIVYHGHGGFVVGSEMSGGVRNVRISKCTFIGTDVGLRFKSTRGRGGVVENIFISDIDMTNIAAEALLFDLYYTGNSPVPTAEEKITDKSKAAALLPKVSEETPCFRNIFVQNVTCKGAGRAAFLQGLPEMNLQNIQLTDINITAVHGVEIIDADGIKVTNFHVVASTGVPFKMKNVKNTRLQTITDKTDQMPMIYIEGSGTRNIQLIEPVDAKNEQIKINGDVRKNEVTIK